MNKKALFLSFFSSFTLPMFIVIILTLVKPIYRGAVTHIEYAVFASRAIADEWTIHTNPCLKIAVFDLIYDIANIS